MGEIVYTGRIGGQGRPASRRTAPEELVLGKGNQSKGISVSRMRLLVAPDSTFGEFYSMPPAIYSPGMRLPLCLKQPAMRASTMNTFLLKFYIKFQNLAAEEAGQDLVEYALITALLAFGWVAGVKQIATALNTAMGGLSTSLGSYVS